MADVMILGENCVYSTDSEKTGLNNNVLVVGSSGSGKTMVSDKRLVLHTKDGIFDRIAHPIQRGEQFGLSGYEHTREAVDGYYHCL